MPTRCETQSARDVEPSPPIAQVVVEVAPIHLDRPFDYRTDGHAVSVGQRVEVLFAGRVVRGLITGLSDDTDIPAERLQPIRRVLGDFVWARDEDIAVCRWAAARFGAPVADVVRHALPRRTVDVERRAQVAGWFPPDAAQRPCWVATSPADAGWEPYEPAAAQLREAVSTGRGSYFWRPLPGEDVAARLIALIEDTLAADRDVLLIVPDSASTIAAAVAAHFTDLVADFRGELSPRRTYGAWLRARCGIARIVIGERGAAFTPLERLGLAVLVDEANPALKERRSPRHHVREVILERARRADGVGLLVGTVPSAMAWRLLRDRRITPVVPTRDAERAARPHTVVVDWQRQARTRMSREALRALRNAAASNSYGIVLTTRKGEGRYLVCQTCGTQAACTRCTSTLRYASSGLVCEGCGWQTARNRCIDCGGNTTAPVAAGTTWIARELTRSLRTPVTALDGYNPAFPSPPATVVVTRGAIMDAPPGPIGAVVLADFDVLLRRPTLDAGEDALRLVMAAASWTVHASQKARGTVIVQTREPEHPAIDALQRWDPGSFWQHEAPLRAQLGFPPARFALRLVHHGDDAGVATRLAGALAAGDELLGPIEDGTRQEFLIKCDDRQRTLDSLRSVRAEWSKHGHDVRVDVDPVDAL